MFCLRSWLPLLFIPTNASPIFIFLFFICTYFLNRPCVYCTILLLILFASSCHWADHCLVDFSSNWFEPRPHTSALSTSNYTSTNQTYLQSTYLQSTYLQSTYLSALGNTAAAMAGSSLDEAGRQLAKRTEWSGIGVEWLRNLLGRREWQLPYVDVTVRL